MSYLTPADIRSIAFKKPPLGRRGYDEEEVDTFLDAVERTVAALTAEVTSLRAQLGRAVPPADDGTPAGPDGRVLAELDQIKARLARIESIVTADNARSSNPLF
jgi:DivIVA domain-containing protein